MNEQTTHPRLLVLFCGAGGEGIRGVLWEHDWRLPVAPPDLAALPGQEEQ